jgi:hypothetical protein
MLIGLNGRLQSGKDTTYEIIQEFVPHAERLAFTDLLKVSAAASLGISSSMMDQFKTQGIIRVSTMNGIISELSGREYLQRYGTEAHRDVFGDNFWVDQVLPVDFDHSNKFVVLTDMRFPNEAERVKHLGGFTVKVHRHQDSSAHRSEQNIDTQIDYFLDNTGTLNDLRANVYYMLNSRFGMSEDSLNTNGYLAFVEDHAITN